MAISGHTRLYCLLGDPVAGSLSPFLFNRAFARFALDAVYTAQRVPAGSLEPALAGLRALGAAGANVTRPQKEDAARLSDHRSERVAVIGAANVLRFEADGIHAENTDATGTVLALKRFARVSPVGARTVILGAGGAARAAAFGLLEAGAEAVSFFARDPSRVESGIARLRGRFPNRWIEALPMFDGAARLRRQDAIESAAILVQATPVHGATGAGGADSAGDGIAALLEDPGWIHPGQVCFDFIYHSRPTAFVRLAQQRGALVLDGLRLLAAQACEAFRIWTGHDCDLDEMVAAMDAEADGPPGPAADPSSAAAVAPIAGGGRPLIVLTGFMGTGKTETARALAALLGVDWIDTDACIEKREGRTVAEIFARDGESRFRVLEAEVCRELADRAGLVVATGGGTLLDAANLAVLSRRGTVVLLEASMETIRERLRDDGTRPLLPGAEGSARLARLLAERAPSYARIPERIDTTRLTPEQAACRIAARLELPHRAVTVAVTRAAETRIEVGRGLLSKLGERMVARGLRSRAFVCLPAAVRDALGGQLAASLEAAGVPWDTIAIRDGDGEKTLEQAGELIDGLAALGAERDAVAVAVGGGVTGDLVGFVASVYMRGLRLVQVPTTLLAQVDASIGGKTGVNTGGAKNLIGSFHAPVLVLSDPAVLRGLPRREIANGMAEVVKTALLGSAAFFAWLERELAGGREAAGASPALGRIEFLERCIAECAAIKAAIVERDPFEAGERRVLNLGHTVGHALETAGRYADWTHGEAVAVGMMAALHVAVGRGRATPACLDATRRVLRGCGLSTSVPAVDEGALRAALSLDKKRRAGRLHFVLPVAPGAVDIVDDVTEAELLAALQGESG